MGHSQLIPAAAQAKPLAPHHLVPQTKSGDICVNLSKPGGEHAALHCRLPLEPAARWACSCPT